MTEQFFSEFRHIFFWNKYWEQISMGHMVISYNRGVSFLGSWWSGLYKNYKIPNFHIFTGISLRGTYSVKWRTFEGKILTFWSIYEYVVPNGVVSGVVVCICYFKSHGQTLSLQLPDHLYSVRSQGKVSFLVDMTAIS